MEANGKHCPSVYVSGLFTFLASLNNSVLILEWFTIVSYVVQKSAELAAKQKQQQEHSSAFLRQRGQKYANLGIPTGGSSSSSSRESTPTPTDEQHGLKSVELTRSRSDVNKKKEKSLEEQQQEEKLVLVISVECVCRYVCEWVVGIGSTEDYPTAASEEASTGTRNTERNGNVRSTAD